MRPLPAWIPPPLLFLSFLTALPSLFLSSFCPDGCQHEGVPSSRWGICEHDRYANERLPGHLWSHGEFRWALISPASCFLLRSSQDDLSSPPPESASIFITPVNQSPYEQRNASVITLTEWQVHQPCHISCAILKILPGHLIMFSMDPCYMRLITVQKKSRSHTLIYPLWPR